MNISECEIEMMFVLFSFSRSHVVDRIICCFLLICETQFKEVYLRTHFNQLFAILMMFLLSSVVCFYPQLPYWYVCTHHGFMYGGNVEKKASEKPSKDSEPEAIDVISFSSISALNVDDWSMLVLESHNRSKGNESRPCYLEWIVIKQG